MQQLLFPEIQGNCNIQKLLFTKKNICLELSPWDRNKTFSDPLTVLCLVAQLCPTLCDPKDCSPPGSTVHGDSPGKNTWVGCHALLQGIFPTQESNPGLPHCRQTLYHLSHQGSLIPLLKGSKTARSLGWWLVYRTEQEGAVLLERPLELAQGYGARVTMAGSVNSTELR